MGVLLIGMEFMSAVDLPSNVSGPPAMHRLCAEALKGQYLGKMFFRCWNRS